MGNSTTPYERIFRIIHNLLKGSVLLKKYHSDFDFTDMDDC